MAAVRGSWEWEAEGMLRRARGAGLFGSLARIYGEFPEVTCEHCARCCFESPGLFFVEYLEALELLAGLASDRREQVLRRALRELFFSWIEPDRACALLEPSGCSMYDRRPLACRLFGVVEREQREQAEVEARLAAEQEARRLGRLGIEVPEAVVQRSLVSCDRVRDKEGRPVRVDADGMAGRVADLDAELLPREVILREFCFQSLGERLGAAAFGPGRVEAMRLELLRRAQRGESVEDLVEVVWGEMRFPGLLQVKTGEVR